MDIRQLSGYYTYRSFLNDPIPVDNFNKVKFAEAELYLQVRLDGSVTGMLLFPAQVGSPFKSIMDITAGTVKKSDEFYSLEFTAQGRPNTKISDYLYSYNGTVSHYWKDANNQRFCLAGTVLRVQDHGSGDQVFNAGFTASFVAVQRDFIEPKDIPAISIIPPALNMMASKSHRLIHALWHTLRGRIETFEDSGILEYPWYILSEDSKKRIKELGWFLERPPFNKPTTPTAPGPLNLTNGAGEDFLYMHRKMISMIRNEYASKGVPYIESWKPTSLPSPSISQFEYVEVDDLEIPGKKTFQLNPLQSGNMMPLPPYDPKPEDEANNTIIFAKSTEFFSNVMVPTARMFTNHAYLGSLSLGALGSLIEFTIHGWMHNRWANAKGAVLMDPEGNPKVRSTFDFDVMWDHPKYDFLGEFYSSHVNPLFWRLHGWVDARIDDWFNAHESMHPGEIERQNHKGVSWFKPGKWVTAEKPFYWPEMGGHHDHSDHQMTEQKLVKDILEIMDLIKKARDEFAKSSSNSIARQTKSKSNHLPGGSMNFIHALET